MEQYKVYLTVDPVTGHGRTFEERTYLGTFKSLQEADRVLGVLLVFCSVFTVNN